MGQYFEEIPEVLIPWIKKQKVFWVATAPLSADGLVNVSPKGIDGTFHIVNSRRVWYEDLTGSGISSVAHLRENSRITVMFTAFEGVPRITRLYGKGTAYEYGTPGYDEFAPPGKRHTTSRAIIVVDIFKVGTTCGWTIPFFQYRGERNRLLAYFSKTEIVDIEAETEMLAKDPCATVPPRPFKGLKAYWGRKNATNVDGMPGMIVGLDTMAMFKMPRKDWTPDDERDFSYTSMRYWEPDLRMVVTFLAGMILSASLSLFARYLR